jgi:HEAT repeat protein
VAGKGPNQIVSSGELAKIVNGQITEKNAADPLLLMLTTRWVNEILVLKGRDNPELARRIDDILAQLGQLKGSFMDEQEIRGLGDRCLLPLSRYLQSPRCEGEAQRGRRQMAARILADMALPWAIPELIELLDKDDPEVRFQAAKGLERLTSVTMGHRPEDWRRNSREIMLPAIKSWQQWWRQNQYRCPAGP